MAYKFNKRDGFVVGGICAVALGIVLISNQPSMKQSHSNGNSTAQVQQKSDSSTSKDSKSNMDSKTNSNDSKSGFEPVMSPELTAQFFSKDKSGKKETLVNADDVKHTSSDGYTISDSATPNADDAPDYKSESETTVGTYDKAAVEKQSQDVDKDPSYIDKNDPYGGGSELKPLTIGDWKFIKGNGDGMYARNDKLNEGNYFELSSPLDWALFNGQVGLSDSDYEKVVRFFNTTKAYMKDNNIEINGFGG